MDTETLLFKSTEGKQDEGSDEFKFDVITGWQVRLVILSPYITVKLRILPSMSLDMLNTSCKFVELSQPH